MQSIRFDHKIKLTRRQMEGVRGSLDDLNIDIEFRRVLIKGDIGVEADGETENLAIAGVHGITGRIADTEVPEILDSIARELPEGHREVTGYLYEENEFHKLVLTPRKGLFWYTFPVNCIHWRGGQYTTVANPCPNCEKHPCDCEDE